MSEDGVVASLMLIHDLYPVPLETRVLEALEGVRPYMESHGGNVTLLGLEDGVARLKLEGSCDGCPASASTLELAIKQALDEAAPDLAGLEVEGIARGLAGGLRADERCRGRRCRSSTSAARTATLQRSSGNGADPMPPIGSSRWLELQAGLMPAEGLMATTTAGEMSILIANVSGSLLAFRDRCASCESELAAGELKGGVLACPECERRFYLPRAGRSMDEEQASARARAAARPGRLDQDRRRGMSGARERRQRLGGDRAKMISSLRGLSRPPSPRRHGDGPDVEVCELCGTELPQNHRHLLQLTERRILCACATCWASALGRPRAAPDRAAASSGSRTSSCPRSCGRSCRSRSGSPSSCARASPTRWSPCTRAPRAPPSPSSTCPPGRSSSELNPILTGIEPDAEALVVNRIADPHEFVIAPIDECYGLVGAIKVSWEGISGGPALEREVPAFFDEMRSAAPGPGSA